MIDLTRLQELLEKANFTNLCTDYLDRDYDPQREGWRIHDLPEEPAHVAYFICDGLAEDQAALFVEAINSLPALISELTTARQRVEELEAALEPFSVALGDVAGPDLERWPDSSTIEWDGFAEWITVGHLRAARAAIRKRGEG